LLLSTPYYKEFGPSEVEMKVVAPMDDVYPTDERGCGLMVHGTLNAESGPPTGIWIMGCRLK
jgi:hypothetical protein